MAKGNSDGILVSFNIAGSAGKLIQKRKLTDNTVKPVERDVSGSMGIIFIVPGGVIGILICKMH